MIEHIDDDPELESWVMAEHLNAPPGLLAGLIVKGRKNAEQLEMRRRNAHPPETKRTLALLGYTGPDKYKKPGAGAKRTRR